MHIYRLESSGKSISRVYELLINIGALREFHKDMVHKLNIQSDEMSTSLHIHLFAIMCFDTSQVPTAFTSPQLAYPIETTSTKTTIPSYRASTYNSSFVSITIPEGTKSGSMLQVNLSDGRTVRITISFLKIVHQICFCSLSCSLSACRCVWLSLSGDNK